MCGISTAACDNLSSMLRASTRSVSCTSNCCTTISWSRCDMLSVKLANHHTRAQYVQSVCFLSACIHVCKTSRHAPTIRGILSADWCTKAANMLSGCPKLPSGSLSNNRRRPKLLVLRMLNVRYDNTEFCTVPSRSTRTHASL